MGKCNLTGCTAEATHLPKLMIPAAGHDIGTHSPMEATLGLPLCEEHAKTFEPVDRAMLQALLDQVNAEHGKIRADISRAWVEAVPLDAMSVGTKH